MGFQGKETVKISAVQTQSPNTYIIFDNENEFPYSLPLHSTSNEESATGKEWKNINPK